MLKLRNSYSKKLEVFKPLRGKTVTMYNCGPTVYDYVHLGNLRSFLFADVLRRYLEYRGFRVKQIMNITDVGHAIEDVDVGLDKIEATAIKEKTSPQLIAKKFSEAFFNDIERLQLKKALHYPRATEHVPEMIKLIKQLLKKKIAYQVDQDIYFDLSKFLAYGKLSGNSMQALVAGHRVELNPKKRHPYDFALWISNPRHIMQWDAPWGRGYPGWHIECSAMSMKYLGPTIDIHTGGEDNKFPHHEAEIAQSEAATGKPFVHYWLHAAHMFVNGEKMSKSAGNFLRLDDLVLKGYEPKIVRYALISSHYRDNQNFTYDALDAAQSAVRRLDEVWGRLHERSVSKVTGFNKKQSMKQALVALKRGFEEAMDNDLNTPKALASLFTFVHELNAALDRGVTLLDRLAAKRLLQKIVGGVLGIELVISGPEQVPHVVRQLLKEREAARTQKNFVRADELRIQIEERGFTIEDTPHGARLKSL